jgi:F-type H+-transporting ATPase subunit epsilon
VYEGDVEMIIVPGAIGEIGVLARHAPLIATLRAGSTRVHPGDGADVLEYATGPGFFQVLENRAIALVDAAVEASRIDHAAAQAQLEAAQAELAAIERGESTADRWQVEQRIRHAENQLAVAGRGAESQRLARVAAGDARSGSRRRCSRGRVRSSCS